VQLDPVEHHHRQPQVGQRAVHQLPQQLTGPVHERPRHRRLRRRAGLLLDLLANRLLGTPVLAGRHTRQHPLQHHTLQPIGVGEMLVGPKRNL